MEGRRHDLALYKKSDTEESLRGVYFANWKRYYFSAKGGYNRRDVVDVPFQEYNVSQAAQRENRKNKSVRLSVEWSYMEVKLYWKTVDFKRRMSIGERGVFYFTYLRFYLKTYVLVCIRMLCQNTLTECRRCWRNTFIIRRSNFSTLQEPALKKSKTKGLLLTMFSLGPSLLLASGWTSLFQFSP